MTFKSLITPETLADISPERWKPRIFQKRAVEWMLAHGSAGLFADPGAGKTSVTLKAFDIVKTEKLARRALVIAPLRPCYQVWPLELYQWTDFHHLRLQVLHGPKKNEALEEDADIYVINPDGLEWLFDEERFESLGIDTLVVDESSKFKHTGTKRFKLLKPHLDVFKRRWLLTGTPNPNGYEDLFGQIYLLDMGKALGRYITHYRTEYFFPSGYGGFDWKLQPDAEKRIQKAIKPYILRLDMEDYLDLPEIVPNTVRVDLPEKARKLYDDVEDQLFAELDSGATVTAVSKGAAYNKCAQIANGGVYEDVEEFELLMTGKRTVAHIHDAKTDALEELIEELQGSPLLIGVEFKHDIIRLQERFGKSMPILAGGVSVKRGMELERLWNRGDIPYMAAHPASMGHGLNMQKGGCHHIAWYGITWDYELYDQFIRRVRRQGNKNAKVFVHHFVARQTVDEAKMRALASKRKGMKGLLDALRGYRKSREAAQMIRDYEKKHRRRA